MHPLHHAACVLRAGARRARRAGLRGLLASSGAGKGGRGELLSRGAHALGQQPSHDSSDSDGGVKRLRQGGLDQQRQQQQQLQTQPEQQQQGGMSGKLVASATVVGGLALLAAGGFLLKDQINTFLVGGRVGGRAGCWVLGRFCLRGSAGDGMHTAPPCIAIGWVAGGRVGV